MIEMYIRDEDKTTVTEKHMGSRMESTSMGYERSNVPGIGKW
jgi:hypothetical protein